MKKTTKRIWLGLVIAAVLAAAGLSAYVSSPLGAMDMLLRESKKDAGTWENDPENWQRAFGENPPADVSVVHSYYWGSDHFTTEFIFFFEVKASPTWREAFIKSRDAVPVPGSNACCFEVGYDGTPAWFVPKPVELYEVWDRPGYRGSLWLNKTNEHFYFYGVQL
jgi:hypothetical protein